MHHRLVHLSLAALFILPFTACDDREKHVKYLVRDDSLNGYYTLDKNSVTMYASPADKAAGRIECVLYSDEYSLYGSLFHRMNLTDLRELYMAKGAGRFPSSMTNMPARAAVPALQHGGKPLAGLVVALDPGHSARTFNEAVREDKYLLMKDGDRVIRFFEADLNLRTALLLGTMLENDGATVLYSRSEDPAKPPVDREPLSPDVACKMGWIQPDALKRIKTGLASGRELYFYHSRISNLSERAELINLASPDITISIHYNMTGAQKDSFRRLQNIRGIMDRYDLSERDRLSAIDEILKSTAETDANYSVVFVPGAFMAGELAGVEARMNFLRLIVTDDLDRSVKLGTCIAEQFEKKLDIPQPASGFSCSDNRYTGEKGVFARNFRMTRLVAGTVCLGEPLMQNYPAEARNLSPVQNGQVPERIKAVADAYHAAILKYARGMN